MIRGRGWPVWQICRSFFLKAAASSAEDVGVALAEQARFVGEAAALREGEVGHREAAGQVLGEEHHPGQVIEHRAQALRAHESHPLQTGFWRFHTKQAREVSDDFHPILLGSEP